MSTNAQNMPSQSHASEKKTKVVITAGRGGIGKLVNWSYDAKFEDGGGSNNKATSTMKFDKGSGAHEVTFSLIDETDFGLTFLQGPTEAFWAAVGAQCPTQAGDGGGEIKFEEKPVGNKLTIVNLNLNEGDLCYAVNFDGMRQENPEKPGTFVPPYAYDPIINNGGR